MSEESSKQPGSAMQLARIMLLAIFLVCPARLAAGDSGTVDLILIEKGDRRLTLVSNGRPIRSFNIALGANPEGHKEREGDRRTPEGRYSIDSRNPHSRYHLLLRISYPDAEDRARAEAAGLNPGGDIMIHGIRNGFGWIGPLHRYVDWTDGCIAVTNSEMEEIWDAVSIGTPVEIRP